MSADQGNTLAQFHYGRCLYYGNGVSQSFEAAARYFKMSADQGSPYGQIGYGIIFFLVVKASVRTLKRLRDI